LDFDVFEFVFYLVENGIPEGYSFTEWMKIGLLWENVYEKMFTVDIIQMEICWKLLAYFSRLQQKIGFNWIIWWIIKISVVFFIKNWDFLDFFRIHRLRLLFYELLNKIITKKVECKNSHSWAHLKN
jgi:hypothetical protein